MLVRLSVKEYTILAGMISGMIPALFALNQTPLTLGLQLFIQAPLFVVGLAYGFVCCVGASCVALGLYGFTTLIMAQVVSHDLIFFFLVKCVPVMAYIWVYDKGKDSFFERLGYLLLGLPLLCLSWFYLGGGQDILVSLNAYFKTHVDPSFGTYLKIIDYFPSLIIFSGTLLTCLNGALGHLFDRRVFKRKTFLQSQLVVLPSGVYAFYALFALITIVMSHVVGDQAVATLHNFLITASIPFFIAGMAIIHKMVQKVPQKNALLTIFYLFMFLFPFIIIIIFAVGLFEPWSRLQTKFH